jgi:CRISPR-associated protein Cas2
MVVMILERAPTSVRGYLTRWLLEAKAGVFVGNVSAMVRDKLWEMVCSKAKGAGCLMIYSSNTEQGFQVRFWDITSRQVVDMDGLTLFRTPKSQ